MARVVLEGVSKVFPGPTHAVQELDLAIEADELTVLVGPSGGGKTTTLRLIAGLETPTKGRIRIGDRDITDCAPHHRGVAMVFQRPALYPHLSVRRNMKFGLRRGRRTADRAVERVARMLEIGHLLDRFPRQLSGGEQQRVALGKAIVRRPAAFLLDEPLAGLDPRLRGLMRAELRELLTTRRSASLFVTHDQMEAMTLADRVVVMDAGKIRQTGKPWEVYTEPKSLFVARFFSEFPLNTLPGKLTTDAEKVEFHGTSWAFSVPPERVPAVSGAVDSELILGIRPEHVQVSQDPSRADMRGSIRECRQLGDRWVIRLDVHLDGAPETVLFWLTTTQQRVVTRGTTIGVRIDWSRARWFDARSGLGIDTKQIN